MSRLSATAALVHFEAGLHALTIADFGGGEGSGRVSPGGGLPALSVQITSPPSDIFDPVDIISKWGEREAWISAEGDTVVVRSPIGGGVAMITVYAAEDEVCLLPGTIEVRQLDRTSRAREAGTDFAHRVAPAPTQTIVDVTEVGPDETAGPVALPGCTFELVLRDTNGKERTDTIGMPADPWSPAIEPGAWIEAFGLTQQMAEPGRAIEYRARGSGGRDTAWTIESATCGSRGRNIPLTGFAIRLAREEGSAAEIVYRGKFRSGFVSPETRNGEMCLSDLADDPLVALSVQMKQATDGHD